MKFSQFAAATVLFASATSVLAYPGSIRKFDIHRVLEGHHEEHCVEHAIDFVMVEGDALRASVEDEIVEMLSYVGIKVNT
mmetsp:Transcript_8666/g.12946  ORF Transcript_8666/g.12946 Transcript_8666/m.12946 type:complete len:80 (+) Transcript_8666:140-379(+)